MAMAGCTRSAIPNATYGFMFDLHVHAFDRAVITIHKDEPLGLGERLGVVAQVRLYVYARTCVGGTAHEHASLNNTREHKRIERQK